MNVYHYVPKTFIGTILYPLNQLEDTLPDVHTMQVAKYRGRDALLSRRLPYLDCLWNDVLHFSPVHPAKLREAITGAGFLWQEAEWFEVDPVAVGFSGQNTIIYTNPVRPQGDFAVTDDDFIPFDPEYLTMLNSIPQETHAYFNHAKANEERPLLFNFIAHVLYRGTLDTDHTGVRRITV